MNAIPWLTVLLVARALTCQSPGEEVSFSDFCYRDGLAYLKGAKKPFTGKAVINYENGQKKCEYQLQNGEPHGKVIWWYESGQKMLESEWRAGQKHGKEIAWYENSNKKWEVEYRNGRPSGKILEWYESGLKKLEAVYLNGELHGKMIIWYESGQKAREMEWLAGELNFHSHKCWDRNGNPDPSCDEAFKVSREIFISFGAVSGLDLPN